MRKTMAISMTAALAIFGINTANAFDYTLSPAVQISSLLADEPALKAGGGEFYPVMNHLKVYGNLNFEKLKLNHDGEDLAIDPTTHLPTISGKIKYTDKLILTGVYENFALPIPVFLAGPMDVGHINFGSGDVSLDNNDKAILRAIAGEVRDTGLIGIYLVGRTDSVGSVDSNFTVSYKRVMAAKAYLKSYLEEIGVTDSIITTEFMGELTATGTDSKSYPEDRRVDVTIYPVI